MVDALALGASGVKSMEVQVLSRAPNYEDPTGLFNLVQFRFEGLNKEGVGKHLIFCYAKIL